MRSSQDSYQGALEDSGALVANLGAKLDADCPDVNPPSEEAIQEAPGTGPPLSYASIVVYAPDWATQLPSRNERAGERASLIADWNAAVPEPNCSR